MIRRFPALERLPRAALGRYPTPVVRFPGYDDLWIKRDDLGAEPLGGNKVRALEFLLASSRPGDVVLTVGARGSTHALSTAVHAARLGARAIVARWRQTMNDDARRTTARLREAARVIDVVTPVEAFAIAALLRLHPRTRWVPAGGTSPIGMLGHVNAGLELAEQVRAGLLPEPARIVLPLGTGGTAGGLALGLAIAGLGTTVIGVRVVPRVVAGRRRVLALAGRTARLIAAETGEKVAGPLPDRVRIDHDFYGGAYGRQTLAGTRAAEHFRSALDLPLDATYSSKAFAATLAARRPGPTLFWLTFDGRWVNRTTRETETP
ncbi:MAG TPA: pyridoxal-phosphate dependent enzyme [Gemmatimonadaceae bacterium]|nr:pyridoxal-phosphate dependent enzyme [Gemmatimonadaceae bacterium]